MLNAAIKSERKREEDCSNKFLPKYICLPLSVPVEMLVHYHMTTGLSYAIDGDRHIACLTSPFADEDI